MWPATHGAVFLAHVGRVDGASPRLTLANARFGLEPATLSVIGNITLLDPPGLTALFCSHRLPAELILPTYDLARDLRDTGVPVIGGFHAPMEREALRFLMRGTQPVIHVPARGLEGMRLSREQRKAIEAGRLLILSPFTATESRLAAARNLLVGALAERVLVIYSLPGGALEASVKQFLAWGMPVWALPGEANARLLQWGAAPCDPGAL